MLRGALRIEESVSRLVAPQIGRDHRRSLAGFGKLF